MRKPPLRVGQTVWSQLGEKKMGTGYSTDMRVLDKWSFGQILLMCCETNRRSGPPDACLAAEKSGEVWIAGPMEDVTDWEPSPHQKTLFVLFLLSHKGVVLFEAVCDTLEKLGRKTAQVLGVLEPLAKTDEPKAASVAERTEESDAAQAFHAVKRERRSGAMNPRFRLGQVVITPGAQTALTDLSIAIALARHEWGDWGAVCMDDWQKNEDSLREGAQLLSAYEADGTKFWVITEGNRSVTTVLLPGEY